MSSLSDSINSLNIENRFDIVMGKLGSDRFKERITVPEASHKIAVKTEDVSKKAVMEKGLKR